MESLPRVLESISFAARAHRHGLRKDGVTPYVAHVFRVTLILRDLFGFSEPNMLIAAALHDTIEDTTTDYDELAEAFGDEPARWVAALTKDMRLPEAEREAAYLAALDAAPWQVHACKLADLYDNLTESKSLSAERQRKARAKAQAFLDAIAPGAPEIQKAIEMVRGLL